MTGDNPKIYAMTRKGCCNGGYAKLSGHPSYSSQLLPESEFSTRKFLDDDFFSMIFFKILVTLQGTNTFSTWGKGNHRLKSALVGDMSVPWRLVVAGRVSVRFSIPLMMFSFDEAGEMPSKLPTTKGVQLNPFSHDHGRGK